MSQLKRPLDTADSLVSNAERVMQNLSANGTVQLDDYETLGACICGVFDALYG